MRKTKHMSRLAWIDPVQSSPNTEKCCVRRRNIHREIKEEQAGKDHARVFFLPILIDFFIFRCDTQH